MMCASCVAHVEKALKHAPGVLGASVNLATQRAEVAFAGAGDAQAVADAVTEAGYAPIIDTVVLGVGGMTCASCVAHVEKALRRVPGMLQADVNLATERARSGSATMRDLARAIEDAGYEVRRLEPGVGAADREQQPRQVDLQSLSGSLLWSAVLTASVFLLEMGAYVVSGFSDWIMQSFGHLKRLSSQNRFHCVLMVRSASEYLDCSWVNIQ